MKRLHGWCLQVMPGELGHFLGFQLMQGLQAMVMEEQVVDTLLEGATVTEKETELDELLNAQRQNG